MVLRYKDFISIFVLVFLVHIVIFGFDWEKSFGHNIVPFNDYYPNNQENNRPIKNEIPMYIFDTRNKPDNINEDISSQKELFKELLIFSNKDRKFKGQKTNEILSLEISSDVDLDKLEKSEKLVEDKNKDKGGSDVKVASNDTNKFSDNTINKNEILEKNPQKSSPIYDDPNSENILHTNANKDDRFSAEQILTDAKDFKSNNGTEGDGNTKNAIKGLSAFGKGKSKGRGEGSGSGGVNWKPFSINSNSDGEFQVGTIGVDDYNHQLYLQRMINKIGSNWRNHFPFQQIGQRSINPGEVVINFTIDNQSGLIKTVTIVSASNQKILNNASYRSVTDCVNFEPPPNGIQYRNLHVRFVYHEPKDEDNGVRVEGTAWLYGDVGFQSDYKDSDSLKNEKDEFNE